MCLLNNNIERKANFPNSGAREVGSGSFGYGQHCEDKVVDVTEKSKHVCNARRNLLFEHYYWIVSISDCDPRNSNSNSKPKSLQSFLVNTCPKKKMVR